VTGTVDGVEVLVIAKSPAPGRVKTRLCPPLTLREAAAVAEASLVDTLRAMAATRATRRTLVLSGMPGPWLVPGFRIVEQRGAGLDERLAWAFQATDGPALLVGMDTPQLTAPLIERCLEALQAPDVDAVLGPAEDGGWWAIGLRRADPRVFLGVPMSSPDTCAAQRERMGTLGLRCVDLPTLRDVDRFEDAAAVARLAPYTSFARAVRACERPSAVLA
jgi:hypothetical protein